MMHLTQPELHSLATRLVREYPFQPSEVERMTLDDILWWLNGGT